SRFLLRCAPLTRPNTCYTSSVILGLGVSPMRRREFIALVGSGVAAWPLAARAQPPKVAAKAFADLVPAANAGVVGFLLGGSLTDVPMDRVTAFHQGLKEAGFVESQNVAIEYRSGEHQTDRLRLLVAPGLAKGCSTSH